MRARLILGVFVAVLANASLSMAIPGNWWFVCHQKGNGEYSLLVVGHGAMVGHFGYGDQVEEAGDAPSDRFCPGF